MAKVDWENQFFNLRITEIEHHKLATLSFIKWNNY